MKKILLLLSATVLAVPLWAQFNTNKSRSRYSHSDTEKYYGLRLGMNYASTSSDDHFFDSSGRSGLAIGAVYGFQLANNTPLWLESGLFYSEKGGKTHHLWGFIDEKVTYRLTYLQLPVVIKYSFNVDDDFYVMPFVGGYLATGIAGKTKYYTTRQVESSFNSDGFHHFDGGLRLGCGAEYKMLYAEVGYDLGLANVSHSDFDSAHTQSFFVNIGVNF